MELELVGELRNKRDHAGVVRPRRKFGEDRLITAHEELDAENAVAAKRFDDLPRLVAGGMQRLAWNVRRLPALAIVAELLAMTDRCAEDDAVARRHRQQGDLAVEVDEFLDDHPRTVAAHVGDGIVPGSVYVLCRLDRALSLARARHDRLHDAWESHFHRGCEIG